MPVPEIMVVAPPIIIKPKGVIAGKFAGSENRCVGLAAELEKVSKQHSVYFFDAGSVTEASTVDGIHLGENQHETLGRAIAMVVSESIAF